MRALWFALLVLVTMPLKVPAQQPPEPSFVVKLGYTKIDLPQSAETTCLAVFPDGRFHMEQTSEVPSSDPRVFEDLLPDESLKSLSAILGAQELKELKTVKTSHGRNFTRRNSAGCHSPRNNDSEIAVRWV